MSTFSRFQEITAWQKARSLTSEVYAITKTPRFFKDFGLREQIRRSSVSIMSNIAEGFERSGKREFIQFLSIAKGSAGETKSLLIVALDQEYIDQDTFDRLIALADETSRMINGLMEYLRKSGFKGTKYRATSNIELET